MTEGNVVRGVGWDDGEGTWTRTRNDAVFGGDVAYCRDGVCSRLCVRQREKRVSNEGESKTAKKRAQQSGDSYPGDKDGDQSEENCAVAECFHCWDVCVR